MVDVTLDIHVISEAYVSHRGLIISSNHFYFCFLGRSEVRLVDVAKLMHESCYGESITYRVIHFCTGETAQCFNVI